jgi:hypothetical protein
VTTRKRLSDGQLRSRRNLAATASRTKAAGSRVSEFAPSSRRGVHLPARAAPFACQLARAERRDHPRAVGRIRAGDGEHHPVGLIKRAALSRRRSPRAPVDRLAADSGDTDNDSREAALRDQLAPPDRRDQALDERFPTLFPLPESADA